MAKDARIDAYIAKAAPFARPILAHLRVLVHDTIPGLDEDVKWGMPHFVYKGKNLAGIAAFKAHCAFVVHGEGRQGDAMGQYGKIARLEDLPGDNVLKAKLVDVQQRIVAEGTAIKRKAGPRQPKPEATMSAEFASALEANPAARATLEAFAPSHRREYVEWIGEAKRAETRDKRIAQAVEWLAEGKKRNWKYEGC